MEEGASEKFIKKIVKAFLEKIFLKKIVKKIDKYGDLV